VDSPGISHVNPAVEDFKTFQESDDLPSGPASCEPGAFAPKGIFAAIVSRRRKESSHAYRM
jgi:hypothetical protein